MHTTGRLLLVLVFAWLAYATPPAFAADEPFVGTWILNKAKSQAPAGAPLPDDAKIVISDAGGGKTKSVTDTVMGGMTMHGEITFAVDGKDYTPTMNPAPPAGVPSVTQSSERVNDRSYKTTLKMGGQPAATVLSEVSADGKMLVQTVMGLGAAAGVSSKLVYDRK